MNQPLLILISSALVLLSAVLAIIHYALRKRLKASEKDLAEWRNQIATMEARVKALERDKQQLYNVVSHDIRGPYNRIFALLQLLQMSSPDLKQDQKDYLGKIHILIADSLAMIRNLNDCQKLENEGIELHPSHLGLSSLLGVLARNHKAIAEKKNIQFHAEIAPDLVAFADKLFFNRIIDNLLSNAIKFCGDHMNVFLEARDEEDQVCITVRDDGPGISVEEQQNLFQKFKVLSAKPTRGETATGLGLYVSKILADKMGALLTCHSEPGRGTTFALRINKQKERL